MRTVKIIFLLAVLALGLAGCVTNKSTMGAGIGAAGGAIAGQAFGNNTQSTLIGAAVGGLLGYIVGNEMDKNDQAKLNQAYEKVPSGQTIDWQNPDNGNKYTVTPQRAVKNEAGQYCRNAQITAVIDGRREVTNAKACRDKNGHWVL